MQNVAFNIPAFLVKAVKTSGHVSELKPLELGIFDRSTSSIATGSGNGNEFFLAGGKPHTKDELSKFYKGMLDPKKSSFFKGKELISFEKAYPQAPQNEEWVIGYNGDPASTGFVFEANKQYTLKLRLFGEYVYRKYNRSVERIIHFNTYECESGTCGPDCATSSIDPVASIKAWAEKVNTDVELSEFKIKATPILSNYATTTANVFSYSINVPDNGDADALFVIRRAYSSLTVDRTAYNKGISTYTVVGRTSAPANFTPTADVLLAACGTCPAGYTLVAGFDSYVVKKQLADDDAISTPTEQTAFAAAVVGAYSATAGSGVFLGVNDGFAAVKINVASGTVVTVLAGSSDKVEKIASSPATCTPAAATAIAWTQTDAGYTITRDLKVTINALDCAEGVTATVADVIASLAGVGSFVTGSASDVTTVDQACSKTFKITQVSKMMKDKCESPDLASFDELPAFKGVYWTPVVVVVDNSTVKVGLRFSAPYYSIKFNDCSFAPDEFYDSKPMQMEVSVYDQSGNPCNFISNSKGLRVKEGRYSRLSGEHVVRELISGGAYFTFEQWSMDPRIREVFDNNFLSVADRKKYYVAYYLRFKESRESTNFAQHGQIWEPMIFVEATATSTQKALEDALQAITSKYDVELRKRG